VTLTFDLLTPKNVFPGLIVEHFCVKFGDPSCIYFSDIVRKSKKTNGAENHNAATAVGVGNKAHAYVNHGAVSPP